MMSFGVPGIRKHTNISNSNRAESCSHFMDAIFSREKNSSTAFIPSVRTNATTTNVPIKPAIRHRAVPSQNPNA